MACLRPKIVYLDERTNPHKVIFKPTPAQSFLWSHRLPDGVRSVALPCGRCFACRRAHALDITVRAVAESRMHAFSSFITLTVSNDNILSVFPHGLDHRPWQLFAKRLRKSIGSFRFLMCGEYGSRTDRPHYHAIIFGHAFVDGNIHCPSSVLAQCWPYGHVMVSPCEIERVAYVAGYTLKDDVRGRDMKWYDDRHIGCPYVRWSRRPGLGASWFDMYRDNMLSDNFAFTFSFGGKFFSFNSRYFFERFRLHDPETYDKIHASRLASLADVDDVTGIMRHEKLRRSCEFKQYQLRQKAYTADL